ncbi:MAG: DNA polymerase III subunit alpha [Spirochaetaceae bacterium]|jgi:DNA polymerase-3 subunit alpha|nr:DNA polymerase III subunit alpha [Spirochaetaceae bacterium]
MTDFVHLHVHSDYSLQDAAVSVMSLADRAEKLGMKYLALTDHGNMFGVMEFIAACEETLDENGDHVARKNPVKPIIGCEVYVAPSSRFEKKGTENDNKYYHLVLLASNREGYFNLVRLCSSAYTEGFYYRPRVDEELLAAYHGGLIALSACVSGEIPRLIQAGKIDEAEAKARHYRDLFGDDNFYLEIQDHGIPAGWLRGALSQKEINDAIAGISLRTGIPLVATNDVHYLEREDSVSHDILLCIGTGKQRSEEKRKRYYGDQFYLKNGDEMAALFPGYPEALSNTLRIAERCSADIPRISVEDLPQYLPEFKIPAGFAGPDAYLRHLALTGLSARYPGEKEKGGPRWDEIRERVEYELDVIIKMNFTGYFLIVADFINWAKERDIPVGPGRGSGAGSIVAYSLKITDIDPLKYDLLFERFLNPERRSMPDFDVDFANEGRDDVIRYVTEKYGKERVGQIITFGTLGARQVIKDVARTLAISIPESEMITRLIPNGVTLAKAFAGEPRLGELEQDDKYTELFTLARKLEGLNRHASLHAAGVVIGKSDLAQYVPLYRDPKTGSVATQYTMGYLEKCGLVKMDFLGLKTLDVIKHTEALIRLRGGAYASFSVEHVPENGAKESDAAFRMLGEGRSFEVFQFESEGMRNVLKQAKPSSIKELIALNALYRPGPMDNIPQFIDSKWGRRAIEYPDPSLEEILKETYGVITYQEQVMQVARIIAGFTLGHADELRRAMGKKNLEKMVKEKEKFIAGAVERGYSEKKADEIFELLIPFAGYGFNKSHAAVYAVVAYKTAYLKANFPVEFMAANLTNEIYSTDKDKLSACIDETRKMGIPIDPPDVNRSQKFFAAVNGRVVYGFLGIKGLGEGAAEAIVAGRQEGPYKDFMDFLNRIDIKAVGKSVVERLILTGAFDSLGVPRETLKGNLERAVEYAQNIKDDKKFGQTSLFGDTGEKEYPDFAFENFPETGRAEKLKIEKELIGFYFSGHPMDEYKELWQSAVTVDLGKPGGLAGSCILIGIIKSVKTIVSKSGKMAYAVLSDYNGEIDLTFFPRVWENCQDRIEVDKVAILRGKIEYLRDKDARGFTADECLGVNEVEEAVRETRAQSRKWDKYRNIQKYSEELGVQLLDLTFPSGPKAGSYIALGILKSLRLHTDKKGNEMAFGTLQDDRGAVDVVFFSRTWKNCKALVSEDEIMAFQGSLDPANDRNPEKPGFLVSGVQDLNKLVRAAAKKASGDSGDESMVSGAEPAASGDEPAMSGEPIAPGAGHIAAEPASGASPGEIHIRLNAARVDRENLHPLLAYLSGRPGCPVYIHVPCAGGEGVVRASGDMGCGADDTSLEELARCAGNAEVWSR